MRKSAKSDIEILELYQPVFTAKDVRIVDVLGGRGRGGSYFLAQHALISLLSDTYFRGFLMRAIHKDVRTSLWRGFRDQFNALAEAGKIDENLFAISDREMKVTNRVNGNTLQSKGFRTSAGGQTANLKSLEGATTIYIEEAEETTYYQHKQLSDSLRTTKGKLQIFRAWNIPTKDHYLVQKWYKIEPVALVDSMGKEYEGYFKLKPRGKKGHLMLFGTYHDNEKNIAPAKREEYEAYFYDDPEHYFSDILGYSSGGAKGVIFKFRQHWQTWKNLPDPEFYVTFGLDFGGAGGDQTDDADGGSKTVFTKLYINKSTLSVYVKVLIYKGYIAPAELLRIVLAHTAGGYSVLADNARQDKIQDLLNGGANVVAAKTREGGSSSVTTGYTIMKKYKLFIHEDDTHAQTELNNHRWAVKPSGEYTGQPEDKFKDVLDAIRYALVNYDLYNW